MNFDDLKMRVILCYMEILSTKATRLMGERYTRYLPVLE